MNNNKKIIIGVVIILIAIAICVFCYFTFFKESKKVIKFEADIHVLSAEEGGRHVPFFTNYRPTLKTKTREIPSKITLAPKVDMVSPGEDVSVTIDLDEGCNIKVGDSFELTESGRIIATGTVTKTY